MNINSPSQTNYRAIPHDLTTMSSTMMVPRANAYHSLPASPLPMGHRTLPPRLDLSMVQQHSMSDDYFGNGPAMSRPRTPFPSMHEMQRLDSEANYEPYQLGHGVGGDVGPHQLSAQICRTNVYASLNNSQVLGTNKYAQIFPHMADDGRYPKDFLMPKTVETLKILDSTSSPEA